MCSLKHNTIKQLAMFHKYVLYLTQESQISTISDYTDDPLDDSNFMTITRAQYRTWRMNDISSSPIESQRPSFNAKSQNVLNPTSSNLLSFKRAIKRDISAYPILKDEKYFEAFKRSLKVTAKTHNCEEVLDPNYFPPRDRESQELFQLKQDFMFSVFNHCLKSDMGKTLVRKFDRTMDAQRVWTEFEKHMTHSSKGRAEKRRLHTYVTTTVLDHSWRGTTEQFVLHYHEQFRQLDDVSNNEEILPSATKMTLLQTAVQAIPELRIVETMEEFMALSHHDHTSNLEYEHYFSSLQNACIRYNKANKAKQSSAARAVYQHDLDSGHNTEFGHNDLVDTGSAYGGIDTPAEEFYRIHTTNFN